MNKILVQETILLQTIANFKQGKIVKSISLLFKCKQIMNR